MIFLKA